MADLEEIKGILRSLLISSPRIMTVEDLRRDYRKEESRECPLLGYRNFTEFLQSIPDVVTVLSNGVVRPVSTRETAHIQQLVALQKKPKPRIRRPAFSSGKSNSYIRSGPPRYSPASKFNWSSRHNPSSRYEPPPRFRPQESLPGPSYTMDQHFAKVREVKEAARREELRSHSAHHSSSNPTPEAGSSGVAFVQEWQKQHLCEDVSQCRRPKYVPEMSDESEDSFYDRFKDHSNDSSGHEDIVVKEGRVASASVHSQGKPSSELDKYFACQSSSVNDKVKSNLKNLMKAHPSGLWACQLPEVYEVEYGVGLNWIEHGYDSVVQMAHDLSDIFLCKRVEGGDWMLFDADARLHFPTELSHDHKQKKLKPDPTVSDVVKSRIFNILKKFTSGIRAEQLAQLYSEHYSKSLISDSPGFNDVESLFISLQDTAICLKYIHKECWVYPRELPESEELSLPTTSQYTESKKQPTLYPEEVMGPGDSFLSPQLPPKIEVGQYIELRVAEVYSPHKFFIILRQNYQKLEELMDELQDFYRDLGSKYIMPDATIVEGICCAAQYSGEWHRCCVQSVRHQVEVFYVDYGTVATVSRSELRFLHKDFSALSAQAIRATMCSIQPANGGRRFTREANHALLEMVVDRDLIGVVQRIDAQEPFLELFLIDTNGDSDIHLNDALVNLEHASFRPDLLEVSNGAEENQTPDTNLKSTSIDQSIGSKKPKDLQVPGEVVYPDGQTDANMPIHTESIPHLPAQPKVLGSTPLPPPGFSAPSCSTPLNPGYVINPYLAAAYLQQVNAALVQQQLQQQQIHQQLLLAYYANLISQPASSVAPSQSIAPTAPSAGGPLQMQQPLPNALNITQANVREDSSSDAPDISPRKKKSSKKKKNNLRPTTPSTKIKASVSTETDSDEALPRLSSHSVSNLEPKDVVDTKILPPEASSSLLSRRIRREDCLRLESVSSDDCDDIAIDHLDDLRAHTDSSLLSSSSSCHVAPDLVQSVGNLRISTPVSNFWRVVEVSGKTIHLFNIEGKAFVSTGELAKKFTDFSTCDTLVRVLKNKDISIPYKKLTRQEGLPLFSALDGCSDEVIKSFDLSRVRSRSVVGAFHLTPLPNIPALLINLSIDLQTARDFQVLRDQFDPNDCYWFQ